VGWLLIADSLIIYLAYRAQYYNPIVAVQWNASIGSTQTKRGRICHIWGAGKQNIVTAHLTKAGAP
jgi:hypothetical protein